MYPRLVHMFYTYFSMDDNLQCTSFVNGVPISLNCTTLNHLLGLPQFETKQLYSTHNWVEYDEFTPSEALKMICVSNDIDDERPPLYNKLTLDHNIISYCILLCVRSHVHVNYFNVFIMWYIMIRKKLDLAHVILHHIKNYMCRKGVLSYGMMLTTIFEHFKVPLEAEKDVVIAKPTDIYSESTLKRMGV